LAALSVGQILEVQVDRLSVGGRGVARFESAVIFIEKAAPNELIQIKISLVKKNYAEATLLKIIKPSPSRVTPPCIYYEECGGCSWQHLNYAEQLLQKRILVQDSLTRMSGFTDFTVAACLPSPKEFRYRNRVQVHIENGELGFFKKNTHQIVNIDDCLITDERITAKFADLKKKSSRFARFDKEAERLELKVDQDVTINSPDMGFSQVNTEQNLKLQQIVCNLVEGLISQTRPEQILDLYCGAGNLSFPLHDQFKDLKIVGVELSAKNISDAKALVTRKYPQAPLHFFQSKVEDFLQKMANGLEQSLVIVDPPRTGCDPLVMKALSDKKPLSIIYVSCHPATLARDLKSLKPYYKITSVLPLDMFPQTDHVETIVSLSRLD
jgi:23S rRNA (uracil1939-C5)-methyltransferase